MRIFQLLIGFFWIIWILYWFFSALKSKRNRRKYNWWSGAWFRLLAIVLIILFLRVPFLFQFIKNAHIHSYSSNPFISSIGFFIFVCGFALSIWARIHLDNNWGMPMTLKEKPELVTTGPYAYIRHPIYLGLMLAVLGTTLVISIIWLIPLICMSFYFVYSLKVEERVMLQQFPKEYKEYKKHTKALIPFIY